MKTLDEVIVELENYPVAGETTLTFNAIVVPERSLNDALHYLKEYHKYLKRQAYEEYCLAEEKKKIKQAYEQGYAQAKHDDEVSRRWEESYRQSQMPWNQKYCEMGG